MSTPLERIRAESVRALRDVVDPHHPVALLDIPTYSNIGDYLILAGEIRYLEELGVAIAYQSDIAGFHPRLLRARMPTGTILINGGGNFGDIWAHHQRFRENLADSFPDYRIVQLPQSLYYRDEANAASARRSLGGHPDFHLLVRESASLERARRLLPRVTVSLVPDMALGCDIKYHHQTRNNRTLVLARVDQEMASGVAALVAPHLHPEDVVSDWSLPRSRHLQYRAGRRMRDIYVRRARYPWRRMLYPLAELGYRLMRDACVHGGIEQFSSAGIVVTDRLHAMILATLLGIPNVAMDNEYGKVGAIYEEYVKPLGNAAFATDSETLLIEWRRFRRG